MFCEQNAARLLVRLSPCQSMGRQSMQPMWLGRRSPNGWFGEVNLGKQIHQVSETSHRPWSVTSQHVTHDVCVSVISRRRKFPAVSCQGDPALKAVANITCLFCLSRRLQRGGGRGFAGDRKPVSPRPPVMIKICHAWRSSSRLAAAKRSESQSHCG